MTEETKERNDYPLVIIPPKTQLPNGTKTWLWHHIYGGQGQDQFWTLEESKHALSARLHNMKQRIHTRACKPLCPLWKLAEGIVIDAENKIVCLYFLTETETNNVFFAVIKDNQVEIKDALQALCQPDMPYLLPSDYSPRSYQN